MNLEDFFLLYFVLCSAFIIFVPETTILLTKKYSQKHYALLCKMWT